MPYDPIAYKAQYERDNYDKILLRVPKGMREEIEWCRQLNIPVRYIQDNKIQKYLRKLKEE